MARPFSEAVYDNYVEFPVKSHDSPLNQLPNGEECLILPLRLNSEQFDRMTEGAHDIIPPEYVRFFDDYIDPIARALEGASLQGNTQALFLHYFCMNSALGGISKHEILAKARVFANLCSGLTHDQYATITSDDSRRG